MSRFRHLCLWLITTTHCLHTTTHTHTPHTGPFRPHTLSSRWPICAHKPAPYPLTHPPRDFTHPPPPPPPPP